MTLQSPENRQITRPPLHKRLYFHLGIIALLNLIYIWAIPVLADEAYYWQWSRRLSLSYFDHPPLVAYLIFISRMLFGNNAIGIRFPVLVLSLFTAFIWVKILENFSKNSISFLYILALSPILTVGSIIITPDTPLICFASLFLYYTLKSMENPAYLIPQGIALGFALLSKYTAILLFPMYLLTFNKYKKDIRFYISFLILPFVMFSPVLIFNARHDFIPFMFQLKHGAHTHCIHIQFFVEYLFDILLVVGLPISAFGIYNSARAHKGKLQAIWFYSIIPVLFFAFFSVFSRQEANWAALAYPGILLLGFLYIKGRKYASALLTSYFLLAVPIRLVPFVPGLSSKLFEKEKQCKCIAEYLNKDMEVFANTYQYASLLSYYINEHPFVQSLNIGTRPNQYDFYNTMIPDTFLFVGEMNKSLQAKFQIDSVLPDGALCGNKLRIYELAKKN